MSTQQSPIIYIMVVGFHHKKGCQLEFVYPETTMIKKTTEQSSDGHIELYSLPKRWRHLPSLALPDGSHNYTSDYIYFHLEDETSETSIVKTKTPNKTLFGLSCYRQMNADELINKDVDVTRNTLQKSVCILSTRPLYASSVRFKLQAITCAYFDQKDFSKTQLLVDAFNSTLRINSTTLSDYSISSLNSCDNYMCLSLGDLVLRYQHKILILFKLLLLQKKCLFQIKPVSSLSNTIIALVSLIPDMLQSNKHGLDHCSGFFDSIDLVNCELERKVTRRNESASLKHPFSTPCLSGRKKLKSSKKSKSSSSSSSASSSPSVSISSSPVSMTSSNFSSASTKPTQTTKKSLVFDPTASSSSLINNLNTNTTGQLNNDENYYFSKNLEDLNLNDKNKKLLDEQPRLSVFKKAESSNQIDLLKSKVSNVFKFDWSTPSTPTQAKLMKSSSSSHITSRKNSGYNIYNDETIDEEEMKSEDDKKSMNIEDLLKLDFGMPLKLFSQFNILHPYLSLYYLDYFTMINKMNTKLYCTTTLMMSMMNEANNKEKQSNESLSVDDSSDSVNYSSSSIMSSKSNNSFKQSPPSVKPLSNQQQSTSYGYTIGATNILFKQRLYDDLDVFIDDTTIDMKQNDALKKQLQLSTADLRFADYIIKQVNLSRSSGQNGNKNMPTLLSIKKTSSTNNLDKSAENNDIQNTSSSFEGSDDWIRLHFKWYLYNLFGSMVKEDLCNEVRAELESEIVKLNAEYIACSSSNSSTLSLAKNNNDVIDIDDYIEKINTPLPGATEVINQTDTMKKSKKNRKLKLSRKNSSSHSLTNCSTLSSISNSYYNYDYSYSNYRDDYSSHFLNEFRQTDCFKNWYDLNRSKLESTLFKLNENEPISTVTTEARLDYLFKKLKQLDDIGLGHPFNGQIGVNDIKLKFNFLITTTESGRKLNKALMDTGKIVNSTGKAVGEAFSHAKSTFSSFLSNWSSSSSSSLLSPMSSPVQLNPMSTLSNSSSSSSKTSKAK